MANKKKQRRCNNEGSVYKRKDGLYLGYVNLGKNEEGKRIRKYFTGHSKEEIERKIAQMTGKLSSLKIESIQNSAADLMLEWLMVFKQSEISSRTFANYISYYKLHIEKHLVNIELMNIDTVILKKIVIKTYEETKSNEVARKVKSLLSQFFDYAVEEKLAMYNPARSIRTKFKIKEDLSTKKKYKAIKPEHINQFLEALKKNSFLETLCSVGIFMGLRIGEILALQWGDFATDSKTLNIEKGITQEFEFDEKGNKISQKSIVSTTKTESSVAVLPVPSLLQTILKTWYETQKARGEKLGVDLTSKESYVFANDDGTFRTYHGTKAIYYRFLRNNHFENKEFHFHALRHTFGTMLKDNQEDIYKIKMLLRHASTKTTERYLSMDKTRTVKYQSDIDAAIEKALKGNKND